MSNELQVPDYVKSMMITTGVGTAENLISQDSVPRITTRGKIFRTKEGDEEEKIQGNVDVIILGVGPEVGVSRNYFKDGYVTGSTTPPDCSSYNGIAPDNWIDNSPSDTCVKCPMNQWGSATSMSGGKAKACKESKHLYVAFAKNFKEDSKVYVVNVTINSRKNMTAFAKQLVKKGMPTCAVITRLTMDEDAEVPRLEFTILGTINEETAKIAFKLASEKEWDMPVVQALSGPTNNQRRLPEEPKKDETVVEDPKTDDDSSIGMIVDEW